MDKLVIYQAEAGNIAVLIPAPACLMEHTIEEIALKDVPAGVPFKIINADELPKEDLFLDAFEIDPALLTDGVGAEYNLFPEKE